MKKQAMMSAQFVLDCRIKYPEMIPVYIQSETQKIKLKKTKLLISENMSGVQFQKRLNANLQKTQPTSTFIYICCNNKNHSLMKNVQLKEVYNKYKTEEGYLYLKIMTQNPF